MPDMSSVLTISQLILILLFISFGTLTTEAAVPQRRQDHIRSCISYGHACWGAHGKRASDKNLLVQKLLSTTMRDASDSKDLKYPKVRQPFTSNQWTPTFSGIYDKRTENDKSFLKEKEIQDLLNSNAKNNEVGNLISYSHDPLYIFRILSQMPSAKLTEPQDDNEEQSDYIEE